MNNTILGEVKNPYLRRTLEKAFLSLNNIKGDIWYVDSNNGADTSGGKSWDNALATIDAAINLCTANKGDVILVAPAHAESLAAAAAIDADVAGISIIGLGSGSDRPAISFITSANTDIDVDAANITFENLYFDLTGIDAVVAAIDVNAADFTMKNCEFLMADGTGQAVNAIMTAAAADRMKIENCIFRSPDAGANEAINLTGATDGIVLKNNHIYGDFAVAPIHNPTGNVATNLVIENNYLQNDQTGDFALELVSACTGVIANNKLVSDAIATALDPGSCICFENLYFDSSDTDVTGTSIPTAPTDGATNSRLGKKVTRSAADIFDGTQIALFTVSGGKVLITAISVEVTTAAVDNTASNTQLLTNPTVGTDAPMCAVLDIDSDEAGSIYSCTGEVGTAMTGGSGGGATSLMAPFIAPEGTIDIVSSADAGTGGALGYCEVWYIPLDASADITST